MKPGFFKPIHPGKVLKNEIKETGATIQAAADAFGIARKNLSLLLNEHASISTEMAVRVSKVLGHTTPQFWLNMQINWDLSQINEKALKVGRLR